MLTDRKSQILKIIANGYISTAVPVPSGAIARAGILDVSPATVRNDMAALEDEGYIHRPHISAGSVPSDKGYRQLVDWLDRDASLSARDARQLQDSLGDSPEDTDEWADTAARILAALLDTMAFATPLHSESPIIKGIQLLELQEMLIMLVVVMKEAVVYRQLISTSRSITPAELDETRNRVNQMITGRSLSTFRSRKTTADNEFDQQVVQSAVEVARRHEKDRLRARKLQGLSRLFKQPEFEEDIERAQMAVTAIESDDVFDDLAAATPPQSGAITFIGEENPHDSLRKFSVVVCEYGVDGEASGVVGILAPTRLAYDRAIPVVTHAGQSLSNIVRRVYE